MLSNLDGKLGCVDAAVILRDAYDDTYGTYGNSTLPSDPFAPVAVNKVEDVHSTSQIRLYIRRYRDYNILKFYGLNFTEFMQLPREYAEAILKECQAAKSQDNKLLAELEDQLNGAKGT